MLKKVKKNINTKKETQGKTNNKNQNIIELKNISKTYFGTVDTQVLFDINTSIQKGKIYSIIGQSGSGKSTLLNIIGTLDKPTTGELVIDGIQTSKMDKKQLAHLRNQKIGFIFQYHYLLENFTVLENTLMPKNLSNQKPTPKDINKAKKLLKLVNITHTENKKPSQISGGERQRAAIARALMNNPPIILADEPTGNLDTENSQNIYNLFREINQKYKTTFIIITHDNQIAKQTDITLTIQDGHLT